MVNAERKSEKQFAFALSVLMGLFIFRVVAQFVQFIYPVSWLPPFEAWHSATLPYSVLCMFQILIIALEVKIVTELWRGRRIKNPKRGKIYLYAGTIYFSGMFFRLIAGQTFLASSHWFQAWLPALFHLVLASFVIINGLSYLNVREGKANKT